MPVVFVSIKPSPSREHLFSKMKEANRLIREYLATQRKTKFIDVFSLMLDAEGKPRKELFGPDMLHMNATGYAIWQKEIEPVLKIECKRVFTSDLSPLPSYMKKRTLIIMVVWPN